MMQRASSFDVDPLQVIQHHLVLQRHDAHIPLAQVQLQTTYRLCA